MDLHKLAISSPDGLGHNCTITLDGHQINPVAVTLRGSGSGFVSAVVEFDQVQAEFDGVAEVVAKLRAAPDVPEAEAVRRVDVRPGDKLAVTFREVRAISRADAEYLKGRVAAVLGCSPDDVLVIAGAELSVLSPEGAPS